MQHTVANNGNKLSIRAGCYTIRYVCTVRVHSNSVTSEKGALRHRMLSTLSRSSLFLSLSHSFLFSFPATALVTNNRSSGIYFITTRVSMPARLSLYAPLEPVIITYHLFLPANAGIGATLLCTHCPKANSLPLMGGGTIPSSTTEPPDNKYSTTNLLTAMKLFSISLSRAHSLSLYLALPR